jgi:hypothetical protein
MVALGAATAASSESASFRQIELLLVQQAFFGQAGSPLVVYPGLQSAGLRFFQIGLGCNHIGFGVRQISLGLQPRAFEQRRIDLCYYLSFFYPRIEIRIEPRNRARNLRTTCTVVTALMVPVASTTWLMFPRSTFAVKYFGCSLPLNRNAAKTAMPTTTDLLSANDVSAGSPHPHFKDRQRPACILCCRLQ